MTERYRSDYPLAIFTQAVGNPSDTFIQRHIEEILPGRTVVVTAKPAEASCEHWSVDCPMLVLDQSEYVSLKRVVGMGDVRRLASQPLLRNVEKFLRQHRVRVIMSEFLGWSLTWVGLAREWGIDFFAHAHGYDVSTLLQDPKYRALYLKFNQSAGVITMSHYSRRKLIEIGIHPAKLHVVPYGVDVASQQSARSETGFVRCLAVGRMVAKKAPILALNAFRLALQTYPNLHLDFVGGGPMLPAARQFIDVFDLHGRVTLHDGKPHQQVFELLQQSDIFMQHSITDPDSGDQEGLPVAILEAMAHGLPVVSTRHAGIPEAVQDGVTGYLVEEGNSVAMADRLVELASNAELRLRLGEAGRCRIREHFCFERERHELLRILGLNQTDPALFR